jgi:hypothetical protein
MGRSGSLRDRLALRALRLGAVAWLLGERLGVDLCGSTEGPRPSTDPVRLRAFDELIAAARAGDGSIDPAACPYPVHELLTHLVTGRGLLLHGSNDAGLDVLEPRPARDFKTELRAVVASDDGIWPLFYAVVARAAVAEIFTACTHVGHGTRLRRFYVFAIGADPAAPASWTPGMMYALPRAGFRREWGRELVSPTPARPVLRIPVKPEDFPLREAVVGAEPADFKRIFKHLRAAKNSSQPAGSGA